MEGAGGTLRYFHPTARQSLMQSARDAERAAREERRHHGGVDDTHQHDSLASMSRGFTQRSLNTTARSADARSETGGSRAGNAAPAPKAPPPEISMAQRRRELLERERAEAEQRRTEAQRAGVRKAAERKNAEFEALQQKLKDENEDFVSKVDSYLRDKDKSNDQKRRALHQNWTECVFNKIQDQLLDRVDTMEAEEISQRRRLLFQNYIDASTNKPGGLFLGIVIVRYRNKPATVSNGPGFQDRFGNPVFDPVKKDLEKLKTEAQAAIAVSGKPPPIDDGKQKLGKETLGHEHWSKMEATPFFDRAAKVQDLIAIGKGPKVRAATKTNIDLNDYVYPTGPEVTPSTPNPQTLQPEPST
ncbi:hypothetical protein T484DRAFT_1981747 [Baffinella frigidus]|nr:hypothetical protein T484DRAFT_1981747 [Cryptophyta sp. CCMP2293]